MIPTARLSNNRLLMRMNLVTWIFPLFRKSEAGAEWYAPTIKGPSSLFAFRGFLRFIGTALRRFTIHSEQVECGKSLGRGGWLRFLHCSAPFLKKPERIIPLR